MWRLPGNRNLQVGVAVLLPFLIMAVIPGVLAPHGPNEILAAPLQPPSGKYLLGTDEIGRDLLSRVIFAARADLSISLTATGIAAVIGITIGLLAGYIGGSIDTLAVRGTDVILAFPSILLAIFMIAVLGRTASVVVLALTILFVPGFVRLSRGLALTLRERGYVEASLISGGRATYVSRRHLLPNAAGPLLVGAALTAAHALLAVATLSYLGLGTQPPNPSWGNMLQTAFSWLFAAPWYGVVPGVCITLVALGYTWFADGVEQHMGRVPTRSLRGLAEQIALPAAGPLAPPGAEPKGRESARAERPPARSIR